MDPMTTGQLPFPGQYRSNEDRFITAVELRWYLQGLHHAWLAMVFGVLGVFALGALLGPLAIGQAKKAEAHGVATPEGKILGWWGLVCSRPGFWLPWLTRSSSWRSSGVSRMLLA